VFTDRCAADAPLESRPGPRVLLVSGTSGVVCLGRLRVAARAAAPLGDVGGGTGVS
jgi:hypothetical protein